MRVLLTLAFAALVACGAPEETGPEEPAGEGAAGGDVGQRAGAGTGDPSTDFSAPMPCGTVTCGAYETCVNQCECCGYPAPGAVPSGSHRCEPMPAECRGASPPADVCRRVIDRPCA